MLESSDAFSDVTLSLPKFDVNFDVAGADVVLGRLGVRSMFQPSDANFSEISDEPLFISTLVHKAVLKVHYSYSKVKLFKKTVRDKF